ncbi:SHOCT domain-containing protein [Streptomyces sp. NPDC001401]|uniref:SHOCT domain-containing protein n=1 Tax=Streptomyces sp. NPDC001401 TaxID=3364570 RepID=UPI00368254A7
MFWYDRDVSGWGWFVMSAGMILFWALIITFGALLFRALARPGGLDTPVGAPPPQSAPIPEQLLAERFARGEIDEDEYHRRLTVLDGSDRAPRLSKN